VIDLLVIAVLRSVVAVSAVGVGVVVGIVVAGKRPPRAAAAASVRRAAASRTSAAENK
jgi:hypothetical protein